MHIFAQHIRADRNSRELRLYLDLKRLDRAPAGLDDEDRMIALSMSGDVEVRSVSWFGSAFEWDAIDDPNFDARLGVCGGSGLPGSPTGNPNMYCDAEFQVELTSTALPPARTPSEAPMLGMAFAMYSETTPDLNTPPTNIPDPVPYFSGALPESFVNHLDDDTDRTQQLSLEFAQPNGVPIKFLSWNLAHWGTPFEWTINSSSPFEDVNLGDMAEIMKDYDVVAVQEMWSRNDALELLDEINARRAPDEQMTLAGPVDFSSSILGRVADLFGANFVDLGTSILADTQGGVFIYSRFPVVESNHIVYSDCRGEDCFKAKGALHVRLALRPPGTGSESSECVRYNTGNGGVHRIGCPADPTGEMYVDVYDTHLQASGNSLCGKVSRGDTWKQVLGRFVFDTLDVMATLFHAGTGGELNCAATPEEVHASQYRQLADFVARTSTDPNRTIIAGDFNTNGRRIGPADAEDDKAVRNLRQYERLLHTLGVYEASTTWPSGPAHIDGAQDDTINLHPDVFAWDIDHGDIAREEDATYDWRRCGVGTQGGTANDTACRRLVPGGVGVPSGHDRDCTVDHAECTHHRCDLWDDGRLDYIFVGAFPRAVYHAEPVGDHPPPPPAPSAPPRSPHPSYLLGRGSLHESLWRRLQPIQSGSEFTCGRAIDETLTLLSDHAPIAGNLMLFPMRQPAKFHPEWDHALEVRVTSTDTTGTADCIGGICGETEVYFNIGGERSMVPPADDGWVWPRPTPFTTNECHGWTLPNDNPNCMLTWRVWRPVTARETFSDEITFKMREADLGRDDHYSITDPASDPRFFFNWRFSQYSVTNQDGTLLTTWPVPVTIRNTDPVRVGLTRTPLRDLVDPFGHPLDRTTPFAGFIIDFHEDDLSRPRAVAR